jgi:hypothetical protein
VFSKPEFRELLQRYKLVQLYCDVVPAEFYAPAIRDKAVKTGRQKQDGSANFSFEDAGFGTAQQPLYVILEPLTDGKVKVVAVYEEGKINDEAGFADFLKKPNSPAGID